MTKKQTNAPILQDSTIQESASKTEEINVSIDLEICRRTGWGLDYCRQRLQFADSKTVLAMAGELRWDDLIALLEPANKAV